MTKVIDIQQLKLDVTAEFTNGNVDIPNGIMNNIIQMHGHHAPAQTGMKFTVKQSGKEINFAVNVDKALGHTAICGVLSRDLSPVVYALVKHKFIEKETIMFEPCKETFGDRIKNIYGHVRLNTLLSCLKKSKTPLEAFHALIEYLEEDTEISGTLGRKESTIKYSFCYDKGARQVAAKLTVFNKDDAATPIVDIELNLNDKNIDILYQSVLSMMNLVK